MESLTTQNSKLSGVLEALQELQEDSTTPKNVKIKLDNIISLLKKNSEDPLIINRSLDELDQLTSDFNLESFTRTQIYNIISLMEMIA